MISKAIERNIRMSARKAGLVCDLVRHKNVNYAIAQLENQHHKAAPIVLKLLKSAIANATNNYRMDATKLYILSIVANEGPTLKRMMPRAKGSATTIRKRSTHIEIILSDDEKDRLLQQESYKRHNKYNDLIHGKLNENSRSNLRMTRKLQSQRDEESEKKKRDRTYQPDVSDAEIYTKEEFEKVVIKDDDRKNKKVSSKKQQKASKQPKITNEDQNLPATEDEIKSTEQEASMGFSRQE